MDDEPRRSSNALDRFAREHPGVVATISVLSFLSLFLASEVIAVQGVVDGSLTVTRIALMAAALGVAPVIGVYFMRAKRQRA